MRGWTIQSSVPDEPARSTGSFRINQTPSQRNVGGLLSRSCAEVRSGFDRSVAMFAHKLQLAVAEIEDGGRL